MWNFESSPAPQLQKFLEHFRYYIFTAEEEVGPDLHHGTRNRATQSFIYELTDYYREVQPLQRHFPVFTVPHPSCKGPNLTAFSADLVHRAKIQLEMACGFSVWYYDPDFCKCLYEGNQAAANRYAEVLQQEEDLAQYPADYENGESATQQALMASAYNGAVPLPFF